MIDRILTGALVMIFKYALAWIIVSVAITPVLCAIIFSSIRRK